MIPITNNCDKFEQPAINLIRGNLRNILMFWVLWPKKVSFIGYHETNLLLIAREIMRILFHHHSFQPQNGLKTYLLGKGAMEDWCQAIELIPLYCLLF